MRRDLHPSGSGTREQEPDRHQDGPGGHDPDLVTQPDGVGVADDRLRDGLDHDVAEPPGDEAAEGAGDTQH